MPIPSRWNLLQNPIHYQGWRREKDYFEGWYFKIVDPKQNLALAFIPGVSIESKDRRHAFLQILDGIQNKSYYIEYPFESFKPETGRLAFQIGPNRFNEGHISIDTEYISAELDMTPWAKFQAGIFRPGIMGWYSFMPKMQCYHGLGSMNHKVNGNIKIDQKEFKIKEGIGYVEKDWGTSFPKSWIWTQCNTFDKSGELSVFASVAHIPWMGKYFIGFLAVIWIAGRMEVFTTYNKSTKQVILGESEVRLTYKKGKKKLMITAVKGRGSDLRSPISGEMRGKVNESLQAVMKVHYTDGGKTVLEDRGTYSGLEVAGPVEILLD